MSADVGLGTLYERRAIYALVERWLPPNVRTALEGPVDGMAGMPGLHFLPVARRGARVTVALADPEAARDVRIVYERAGLSDRLDLVGAPAPDRTYDLVLSFNALAGPEWREDLARTLARANGTAIVVVTNRSSWGVGLRRVARLFETGREVEPWEHEATRPEVVEPELRLAGRIADRAWLDCPWWPDLFVTSGETLVGATLRRIGIDRPTRSKLRFGAESFPFTRGALDPALARALALHPGFDGVDARWVRRFAHHRAYRVEVTRGPGTGTTRPSP